MRKDGTRYALRCAHKESHHVHGPTTILTHEIDAFTNERRKIRGQ